jgi:hypothetical protein
MTARQDHLILPLSSKGGVKRRVDQEAGDEFWHALVGACPYALVACVANADTQPSAF